MTPELSSTISSAPSEPRSQEEDLRAKLKRLLAEKLGVPPSEITPEFILEYRRQHIYPNMKVDFTSRYGGLNPPTHQYYTEAEIVQLQKEIDEFLESLG